MPGAVIKSGAVVEYAIVGEDSVIEGGSQVGTSPENIETMTGELRLSTQRNRFKR